MGQRPQMSLESCRGDARRKTGRRGGDPPDRASLYFRPDARFGLARCYSLAADEAEAVLVDAAGAVAGGKEVQLVDHVVVAAYEGLIDPCPLQDRQFEGSFQEPPALPVVNKICVAVGEPHRKRAPGDVIGTQVPVELYVEVADRLVGRLARRGGCCARMRCRFP